jgi:DNA mismatch endonuclease (patch repair protein)
MPDKHTKEQRSYSMSRIRRKGTKAELCLGELLRSMYSDILIIEHAESLPGKPDYWIPEFQIAVFAGSCFFHNALTESFFASFGAPSLLRRGLEAPV